RRRSGDADAAALCARVLCMDCDRIQRRGDVLGEPGFCGAARSAGSRGALYVESIPGDHGAGAICGWRTAGADAAAASIAFLLSRGLVASVAGCLAARSRVGG